MKHWLNNWEKYIGKRLSNAEAMPDNQVWTRIERELDAELIDNRNRGLKRTAGILLLLLLLSSTFLLTNHPKAERALAGNLIQLNDIENSGQWTYNSNVPDNVPDVVPDNFIVSSQIIVADLVNMEEVQPFAVTNTVDANRPSIEEEQFVLELAEIEDDNFDFKVPLQAFANVPVRTYYQSVGLNGRAGGVELNNDLTTTDLHTTEHKARTGKRELMNRIAASTIVSSPLLVWSYRPDLKVNSQVHNLAMLSTFIEADGFVIDDEQLAMSNLEAVESKMIAASDDITTIPDEIGKVEEVIEETALVLQEKETIAEVIEMEQLSWMAGTSEELQEWKELMEEMSETEKEELEELIEEAVIEEEDPLTRKQNEAMNLYRSYNVNKGFHIGLVMGFQNTWVTKETRNPEIDRSVVNTKMAPGYQVGINMGYDITDHFGLMMELKFSDEGGRYYNPVKGRTEHLDLKYFEVPIYAKVKHSKMTQKLRPIVFNYLVGVTYSDLRKMSATIDGSIDQRFGQDYNTTQWGLSAGFDFDFYIHKNFFWTIGTRAGVSGDSKAFPKFKGEDGNSAMTIDAGVYTRLSFRLPGR